MIKVGIIGGAGYTAGELIRILINHPDAEIKFIHSSSNAGNPISDVHQGLLGETDLYFTSKMTFDEVDVVFLCMGHGDSTGFMAETEIPDHLKVIDLSNDFRLKGDHNFIYGLPELNRRATCTSTHVANPGCFATAIQLALLPLAKNLLLNSDVHVNAITGSTGAGQKPTKYSHFSWRNNNVSVYKAFQHQHLGEIVQSLKQLQNSFESKVHFIPVRGNFSRGILAMVYTQCDLELTEAKKLYKEYYAKDPFTIVSEYNPDLKQVVNTNKCVVYLEKHDDQLLIITAIDNLVKGASGQAVQNMNLMFELEETIGLRLKATAF